MSGQVRNNDQIRYYRGTKEEANECERSETINYTVLGDDEMT